MSIHSHQPTTVHMPHRHFHDDEGSHWEVWDVHPTIADRQIRRTRPRPSSPDVSLVQARLAAGWLCFECGDHKRRLAPIPSGWDRFAIETLRELCARATVVPKRAAS
jgi:hypothetical protein